MKKTTMSNVKDWLREWLELFPQEAEFNGYKIRSKERDCINKMLKFVKDFPNYKKDIIFAATKRYVEEKKAQNWEFMKQATYFISKVGQPSLLEAYCEKILSGEETKQPYVPDFNPINDFI